MDISINWKKYETTFLGEKVSMEIRPLKAWAWYELAPYMGNDNPMQEGESKKDYLKRLTPAEKEKLSEDSYKTQMVSKKILSEHVRNITGITVNKQAPTWEQLSEEVVFMPLTVEICYKLVDISTMSFEVLKNLNGLSESQASISDDKS